MEKYYRRKWNKKRNYNGNQYFLLKDCNALPRPIEPEDVKQIAPDVLRHRIMLSYEANADGITADQVIDDIVKRVAVA